MTPISLTPTRIFTPVDKQTLTQTNKHVKTKRHLTLYNLREVIGPKAEGIMLYGIEDCCYKLVDAAAKRLIDQERMLPSTSGKRALKPLRKIYDWTAGSQNNPVRSPDEQSLIPRIEYYRSDSENQFLSRKCKAGITNITIYNALQEAQNKDTIPILFCIEALRVDPATACRWRITLDTLLSRADGLNDKFTMKEVRRAGKLCFDKAIDKRVRKAAQNSIIFVKVTEHLDKMTLTNTDHYTYTLTKIDPPWGTTKESINAFRQGLAKRAAEKETDPFGRVLRRTLDFKNDLQVNEKRILINYLKHSDDLSLTPKEKADFDKVFDWDAALASDRTFFCLKGKTVKQAYIECLEHHLETPCFRQQTNELIDRVFKKKNYLQISPLLLSDEEISLLEKHMEYELLDRCTKIKMFFECFLTKICCKCYSKNKTELYV